MIRKALMFVLFSAAASMAAPASETPQATSQPKPSASGPSEYRIGAGDVLTILTWKEADFSGAFQVRYDGKITMPLVGDIVAASRTPAQLSKQLEEVIGRFVELPRVTVMLERPDSAQYFVLGKVGQQGAFPYVRAIRLAQALAIAGGFQEFAKKGDIFVIREVAGKQVHFAFNYDDFLDKRRLETNLVLFPGDTIVVP